MTTRTVRMAVAIAAVAVLAVVPAAWAVHDIGLFELDRDAFDDLLITGDDWDLLYAGGGGAEVFTFIADGSGASIFTTGGSKDVNDVSEWAWTDGNVPDKDDILNAYAALYRGPGGHFFFYFGLDRYANNGDAQVGFWFLQQPTYMCGLPPGNLNAPPGGCPAANSGKFVDATGDVAVHADGDLLVLAHFTGGGAIISIEVFRWTVGAPDNPVPVTPGEDDLYAVVNQDEAGTPSPWPFQTKINGYDANVFPPGSFFEAGIDLTALMPNVTCFSDFIAETRSSQSLDAQLKDLAFGRFATCGVAVEKTGPALSKVGDEVVYHYEIFNTGMSPMHLTSALDQSNRVGAEEVDLLGEGITPPECDELAPEGWSGDSCAFDWPYTPVEGDPDPLENTVTVTYNSAGPPDYAGVSFLAEDALAVNLFQPAVEVTKEADAALGKVGDVVTYTFTIANTGSADSPDLLLDSVSDDVLGDLAAYASSAGCDTLAVGGSCTFDVPYTVLEADADPLVNTVAVHYHPENFPNDIADSDSHELNLFQPGVEVAKSGPALSKAGDPVSYTFTITNTGSADSPALVLDSIVDDVLGDLAGYASGAGCDPLASGASCVFEVGYTVQADDPDPLVNTVTVHFHPDGFPNDITDSDSHTLNLFQPEVRLAKSGTTLSKVGDPVTYTFTIWNAGSSDSPDLILDSMVDDVLGDLAEAATQAGCGAIPVGGSCAFDVEYTVQPDDPDPLVNTVTLHVHPEGFPNDLTATDSHAVELFQPGVEVAKSGPALSKAGDPVTYTFTITNTGSADSPDLVLDSMADDVLGDLALSACSTLPAGSSCTFEVEYVVQADDPDPLVNTVVAHFHPDGFPNDITDSDSHTLNLFQPGVEVAKNGPALSKVGDPVTYGFTITNVGSADSPDLVLDSVADDVLGDLAGYASGAGCGQLAAGSSCSFEVSTTVPSGAPDPLVNTVVAHFHPDGFPNDITDSDSHTLNLFQPGVEVTKNGPALSKVGDPVTYTFTIANTGSADSPDLVLDSVADDVLGDLAGYASGAGCGQLAAGSSCSFDVSTTVPSGASDPLVNTVVAHFHPDGFPNDVSDSDSHELNLFQPAVAVQKSGPTLSKVGDPVTYGFTITNIGSADSPDLVLDGVADDVLGDLAGYASAAGCGQLAVGTSCSFDVSTTVPSGAPDPLVNTVVVHTHPSGFANDITDSASHTLNLFQPSLTFVKTGDPYSKAGDTAHYTVTLSNTSSADSPALECTISDPLLGLSKAVTLASGAGDTTTADRVVLASDPDPLVNTASVTCSPIGFPNVLSGSSSHTTDLVHPDYTVGKDCISDQPVPPGAAANFRITVANTGDVPLVIHVVDLDLGIDDTLTLAAGDVRLYEDGVLANGVDVFNAVTVYASLPAEYGLDNTYEKSASAVCDVGGGGATRTPGFWKTHVDYATHVFDVHLANTDTNADGVPDATVIDLGWKTVTSIEQALGLMLANTARESDGDKRSRLCQAREQASFHAMAAILNSGLHNGAGLPASLLEIATTLGGTDVKAIRDLAAILAAYNESGDGVAIVDVDGYMILHADPSAAAAIADIPFADCS